MRTIFYAVSCIFILFVFSCGEPEVKQVPEEPAPWEQCTVESIQGKWKVISLMEDGKTELTAIPALNPYSMFRTYPTMSLTIPEGTSGTVIGHSFSDVIGFNFEISEDDQRIAYQEFTSRLGRDTWSKLLRTNLLKATNYCFSNGKLFFLNSKKQPVIEFEEETNAITCVIEDYSSKPCSGEPITGTWNLMKMRLTELEELVCIQNPGHPSVVAYPIDCIQISVTSDGTGLVGYTLSNRFNGKLEVNDGENFYLGSSFATRVADEYWGYEFYFKHLKKHLTYCISDNELIFYDEGTTVLVFERMIME